MSSVLAAVTFAAEAHKMQQRKNGGSYICHPLRVALSLRKAKAYEETQIVALNHDVLEDTPVTATEMSVELGAAVTSMVVELTDDKSLPKEERKIATLEHAKYLSPGAALVKMADMLDNRADSLNLTRYGWSKERVDEYMRWSGEVLLAASTTRRCRGWTRVALLLLEQSDDPMAEYFHQVTKAAQPALEEPNA